MMDTESNTSPVKPKDQDVGSNSPASDIVLAIVITAAMATALAWLGAEWALSHLAGAAATALAWLAIAGVGFLFVIVFRRRIITAIGGRVTDSFTDIATTAQQLTQAAVDRDPHTSIEHAFDLGRRYLTYRSWITTRYWMAATILSLLVAFSGLAASALLFQQTKLLGKQTESLEDQTTAFKESNNRLKQQIEAATKQNSLLEQQFLQTERSRLLGILYDERDPVSPGSLSFTDRSLTPDEQDTVFQSPIPKFNSRVRAQALKSYLALERKEHLRLSPEGAPRNDDVYIDLRGALLQEVGLYDYDLSGIIFESTHFDNADLRGCDFRNSYLRDASFRGADCIESQFNNASDLDGANFVGASLQGVNFEGSALALVDFDGVTTFQDATFRGADLMTADLEDADLRGVDLRDAFLLDVDLTNADLRGADLRGAFVDFEDSESTLKKIQLIHPRIYQYSIGEHFKREAMTASETLSKQVSSIATQSRWNRVEKKQGNTRWAPADLLGANLKTADLRNADLRLFDHTGADLTGAIVDVSQSTPGYETSPISKTAKLTDSSKTHWLIKSKQSPMN